MTEVTTIAVLGAGDMGHGIAELAALRGFTVRMRDVKDDILTAAMQKVRWSLDKLAEKNVVTKADADAAFGRITTTTDLKKAVSGAELVIEAIPERLELKQSTFAELEAAAPAHAVLASNTSTMMMTDIGARMKDPGRLVGMHFFNPVLLMDLIEVIPGPKTTDDAVQTVQEVSRRLGKTCVTLKKDAPGFVTSRLVGTWVGASVMAHEFIGAKPEQIDSAMRFKAGFPMGPFELADYTGLDIGAHAGEYIASKLGPHYAPSKALKARVEKGELGKKTGRGFYTWKDGKMAEKVTAETGKDFDTHFILAIVANEAAKILEAGIATAADIDKAMRQGCAFPKGPLEWADEQGLDVVHRTLDGLHSSTRSPIARPADVLTQLVKDGKLGRKSGQGFFPYAATHKAGTPGAPAPYETVVVDVDEAAKVGTIRLNRPHRLNAINDALIRDLSAALDQLDADARVRVIVLTGTGEKAFCVGADLQDAEEFTPVIAAEVARTGHLACIKMEKLGKPLVAAVNGYAFGGGLELTLPCDFRLAAKRAQFALPEVTLGLLPAMGGTQRLPKLIGLSAAKEIALLGNRIDADRALQLGLVHRVFANESFETDVKAFAAELATRAPIALRHIKRLLNASPTTDILAGMEAESLAFGLLSSTEDVIEGVGAMFQKKKAEFRGK